MPGVFNQRQSDCKGELESWGHWGQRRMCTTAVKLREGQKGGGKGMEHSTDTPMRWELTTTLKKTMTSWIQRSVQTPNEVLEHRPRRVLTKPQRPKRQRHKDDTGARETAQGVKCYTCQHGSPSSVPSNPIIARYGDTRAWDLTPGRDRSPQMSSGSMGDPGLKVEHGWGRHSALTSGLACICTYTHECAPTRVHMWVPSLSKVPREKKCQLRILRVAKRTFRNEDKVKPLRWRELGGLSCSGPSSVNGNEARKKLTTLGEQQER